MPLPLRPPIEPMEATSVDALPESGSWQYEPKWDGFRCLVFRDGPKVDLQSKSGQPLARYFPELVEAIANVRAIKFVLDCEIVIPIDGALSFDALLQRIHPAASRIKKLASETPTLLIAFDLLVTDRGRLLTDEPLAKRRPALEKFSDRYLASDGPIRLSPASSELKTASSWWKRVGGDLDGVIAKNAELNYRAGLRDGMVKVKRRRTVDCVVGGFRYLAKRKQVGSLLLGLYDDEGLLNHVGFTSAIAVAERPDLTARLQHLEGGPGFTGKSPGGPSRWSTKRSAEWVPLKPKLVVEVEYDHFTGGRFRHGTNLLRWRPDKEPRQCKMDQISGVGSLALSLIERNGKAGPGLDRASAGT